MKTIEEFEKLKVQEMRDYIRGEIGGKLDTRATKSQCIDAYKAYVSLQNKTVVGVDLGVGEDKTVVSVMGTETGRFHSDQPNLARTPLRTEDGAELQKAMANPALEGVDYATMEARMVASFGGAVIQLPPESPVAAPAQGRGRRDEVVSAVNRLKLGLELATLRNAMGGANRHARRKAQALTVSLKRKLSAAGVTLEEALAAL